VINKFNTGSDHRLPRGTLNIDFKAERVETKNDVNQNLENMVRVLREEGTRFCNMRRKGRKSKLSEETLGLMKQRWENLPVT
jgi:transposase